MIPQTTLARRAGDAFGLRPSERTVLLLLASYADDSARCWPSTQELARACGVTSRSIRRAIAALRACGLIAGGRRGATEADPYNLFLGARPAEARSAHERTPVAAANGERTPVAAENGERTPVAAENGHQWPLERTPVAASPSLSSQEVPVEEGVGGARAREAADLPALTSVLRVLQQAGLDVADVNVAAVLARHPEPIHDHVRAAECVADIARDDDVRYPCRLLAYELKRQEHFAGGRAPARPAWEEGERLRLVREMRVAMERSRGEGLSA